MMKSKARPKGRLGPYLPYVQYVNAILDDSTEQGKHACFKRCTHHPWIRKSKFQCASACGL